MSGLHRGTPSEPESSSHTDPFCSHYPSHFVYIQKLGINKGVNASHSVEFMENQGQILPAYHLLLEACSQHYQRGGIVLILYNSKNPNKTFLKCATYKEFSTGSFLRLIAISVILFKLL